MIKKIIVARSMLDASLKIAEMGLNTRECAIILTETRSFDRFRGIHPEKEDVVYVDGLMAGAYALEWIDFIDREVKPC